MMAIVMKITPYFLALKLLAMTCMIGSLLIAYRIVRRFVAPRQAFTINGQPAPSHYRDERRAGDQQARGNPGAAGEWRHHQECTRQTREGRVQTHSSSFTPSSMSQSEIRPSPARRFGA